MSPIFGDGRVGVMASKLRDCAQLLETASGSLLGGAGSVIMTALATAATEQTGGTGGALNLLRAQRDELPGLLPADFAKSLQGAGVMMI